MKTETSLFCTTVVIIIIVALVLTLSSFTASIFFASCSHHWLILLLSLSLSLYLSLSHFMRVEIEIWIENCYHKHIWLGLFLYARTQFAVNSITENIINHFGSFSLFFSHFQLPISMCATFEQFQYIYIWRSPSLSLCVLLQSFYSTTITGIGGAAAFVVINVFYSISFSSSLCVFSCQLVNLWCKRFLFIYYTFFSSHFALRFFSVCDCRIGRCRMNGEKATEIRRMNVYVGRMKS